MERFNIENMIGGWFVGDFQPSVLQSQAVEVAVKWYSQGHTEDTHIHKLADEVTVIISGSARINGEMFYPGDIVMIHRGEAASFHAIEQTSTVVVKMPSVRNDKYKVIKS